MRGGRRGFRFDGLAVGFPPLPALGRLGEKVRLRWLGWLQLVATHHHPITNSILRACSSPSSSTHITQHTHHSNHHVSRRSVAEDATRVITPACLMPVSIATKHVPHRGGIMCIGGPALVIWVTPSPEELFKASSLPFFNIYQELNAKQRYNPELQKRSLENRAARVEQFEDFMGKLRKYSQSDKPIWQAAAEDEANTKQDGLQQRERIAAEIQKRRDEIKRQSIGKD